MQSILHTRQTTIFDNVKNLFRPFALLFGVYFISIFSLIRANRLYLDDMGRALYGYADWSAAARPVADLLAFIFFMGPTTLDASPFTQIVAIAFLALFSILLCRAFKVPLTPGSLLCTIPIGLSPYGLENLSYRFDSPWMALAMLLSFFPFVYFFKNKKVFFAVAVLCLFLAASIYQGALGVYISIAVYTMLVQLVSRRKTRKIALDFLWVALPFCLSILLYALQAPLWFNNDQYGSYVDLHNTIPSLSNMPMAMLQNLQEFLRLILTDWAQNSLGFLFLLLIIVFTLSLFLQWRKSMRNRSLPQALFRLVLVLLLIPCLLFSPLGIQVILEEPVWTPRTFCSFGTVLALMLLWLRATLTQKNLRFVFRVLQLFLLCQLIIFSQVYGNLLSAQTSWEESRISALALGLNQYIAATGHTNITFTGSIGQTPLIKVPARRYPLLERMVTVPLTRQWRWGYEQLKMFGIYVTPGRDAVEGEQLQVFSDTLIYHISTTRDGVGFVNFKKLPFE